MDIVKAPDSRLRVQTKPVKKVTPELLKVAREMIKLTKTFQDPEGVGLASTQVGRVERFFVGKVGKGGEFITCFNPKVLSVSKKTKVFFEGCLSIPNFWGEAQRPISILVEYTNKQGEKVKKRLFGSAAWIFQHEVDHLDGKLFMDHVLGQKGKVFKVVGRDKAGSEIFEEVRLI
ncbi:MAG: peptide deformylase [bacterium]|nr:peptide deformylase [bacterium]